MLIPAALILRDHTNAIVILDIFEMGCFAKVKYSIYYKQSELRLYT